VVLGGFGLLFQLVGNVCDFTVTKKEGKKEIT
jgi:geranylgeranyl pyrophosphate synthase